MKKQIASFIVTLLLMCMAINTYAQPPDPYINGDGTSINSNAQCSIYGDDYSTNANWTTVSESGANRVSIGGGRVHFTDVPGDADERVYHVLTSYSLGTSSWTAEFQFSATSGDINRLSMGVGAVLFGFTSENFNPQSRDNPNMNGINAVIGGALYPVDWHTATEIYISYQFGLPPFIRSSSIHFPDNGWGLTYYARMRRIGATVELSVYSDPARTTPIPGSPVQCTIPIALNLTGNISGGTYLQHSSQDIAGYTRRFTGWVDNTCIYPIELGMISDCELARIDSTTLTVWKGTNDNDWFNAANWNFGVPGGVRPNAWIPSRLANYPTISNPGAICHDIYIRDGASILGNGFLSISGLAYVERLVNHLGLPNYWQHCNWFDDSLAINYPADIHYLSSPVPDAKDSTVEQDAVWRWQEPDQYWIWLHHSCKEPCKGPPWIWKPGIGYSVAPNEYWWCQTTDCPSYNTPPDLCVAPWKSQFYREFIDNELNYGPIDVSLTHTLPPAGMYPPGWNLLGNPYPSAIDWFAVPTVNVYSNSACIWCDTTGGYKYVVSQNGFIPIIQGFMVQCGPGGGLVTFTEASRLHNNNAPLWKSEKHNFLKMQVSNNVNSYKDETFVAFDPEAEDGFDLLDGTKLGNASNAPMIYSVLPDNTSLAVNSLSSSETTSQVPVYFKAGVTGTHTINISGIESIDDNTPLYIEDRKLDISQDIRENPVYSFTANPSDDRDRFLLHFAPLGVKDFSQSNVSIYSYNKNVCINVPDGINGTVSVINLLGMEILSQKIIPGKLNKISVTGPTGYYLVRVVSSGDVSTKKVFIN